MGLFPLYFAASGLPLGKSGARLATPPAQDARRELDGDAWFYSGAAAPLGLSDRSASWMTCGGRMGSQPSARPRRHRLDAVLVAAAAASGAEFRQRFAVDELVREGEQSSPRPPPRP